MSSLAIAEALGAEAIPVPPWDADALRDDCVLGRVGQDVVHGPAHVGAQGFPKCRIGGQLRVVERANETLEEPFAEIAHVAVTGMHREDSGLIAAGLRVARRPAEHLGPVRGQALDVLGMLIVVGERVVELGIRETSSVMGLRQSEKCCFPTSEVVERRTQRAAYGVVTSFAWCESASISAPESETQPKSASMFRSDASWFVLACSEPSGSAVQSSRTRHV